MIHSSSNTELHFVPTQLVCKPLWCFKFKQTRTTFGSLIIQVPFQCQLTILVTAVPGDSEMRFGMINIAFYVYARTDWKAALNAVATAKYVHRSLSAYLQVKNGQINTFLYCCFSKTNFARFLAIMMHVVGVLGAVFLPRPSRTVCIHILTAGHVCRKVKGQITYII